MMSFVYKSRKKDELYLYLAKKDDFTAVPEALFQTLGEPVFVMELELTPERKLAREDVNVAMKALAEKGYFIQLPPTRVPGSDGLR
ncbi:MAG: YcgL domain-containing protein [Pseudomonadota bacterium]